MANADLIGIIEFTDNHKNGIETFEYTDAIMFKKEIQDSLECGRPINVTDFTGKIYVEVVKNLYGFSEDESSTTEEKFQNTENRLLLESYRLHYNVSAPIIDNHQEFFDIYRKLNDNSTVSYEVKFNPLGFGDNQYYFMYVNTFADECKPFKSINEVKVYMDKDSINKFVEINNKTF